LKTNFNKNEVWGYSFTPQVDGFVSALGGYYDGNKQITLYKRENWEILATEWVSSSYVWSYKNLAPIAVHAGVEYYIVVNNAGSGGARWYGDKIAYNKTIGDILVNRSVYGYIGPASSGKPVYGTALFFYGVDIKFYPGN
jgi:hypothetical protein